jgi:alanine racemase
VVGDTRTWADVDLDAVAHNVGVLRRTVDPAAVVAVVKADGYGHGAVPVAAAALDAGAAALGVAIAGEGVEQRDAGIDGRIVVLSEPRAAELPECVAFGLEPALYTAEGVAAAAKVAADHGRRLPVHVKVDTGMHRVGVRPADVPALVASIVAEPALELASVWTHCAVADEPDDPYTAEQLARYDEVLAALVAGGDEEPKRHSSNWGAAEWNPAARYDLLIAGIAVYGIAPSPDLLGGRFPAVDELRPALSWKARVSFVKVVGAGERISYGLRHRFERDTVVATVPVGYADGVARNWFAVGGEVLVGGRPRRVVGAVTMDQLMVDCGPPDGRTDADGRRPDVGDEAVLIGSQGDVALTADDWAERLGTIAYEIVCGIGPRVVRRYDR